MGQLDRMYNLAMIMSHFPGIHHSDIIWKPPPPLHLQCVLAVSVVMNAFILQMLHGFIVSTRALLIEWWYYWQCQLCRLLPGYIREACFHRKYSHSYKCYSISVDILPRALRVFLRKILNAPGNKPHWFEAEGFNEPTQELKPRHEHELKDVL